MIPPIKRCGGCEGTLLGLRITIGNKLQIFIYVYIYMKCLWIALKKKNLNFFENSKNTTIEFWVQSLKHEYGVRRSWVGTMEMMHATQNEEQLCPNPNLKCTREWSGLGLADQNWHLCWTADSAWELSWVKCERKTQLLLTQAFVAGCGGDGGGEWGTSFSKKVLQKGPGQRKMPTSCVFALCKDMLSKKLV